VRVTRRRFVHLSLTALGTARLPWTAVHLRVHLLVPAARSDLLNGVVLGVDEAKHTASLMAATIEAVRHESLDDLAPPTADTMSAIIVGHDAATVVSLAARLGGAAPVINVAAGEDELRAGSCDAGVFHVGPSESMLDHALREATAGGSHIAAWHPTLYRYGAEQLNDRYRARFRGTRGMPAAAWCGWMGVKILSEAALRSRATTNAELMAWMSSSRARFDGHKGVALTFDARRQLVQPLYVISSEDRVATEVIPAGDREGCA
jgi:hypothetical protein